MRHIASLSILLLLFPSLLYFDLFWTCVFVAICISLVVETELYYPEMKHF